jgi:hypothetical protein
VAKTTVKLWKSLIYILVAFDLPLQMMTLRTGGVSMDVNIEFLMTIDQNDGAGTHACF